MVITSKTPLKIGSVIRYMRIVRNDSLTEKHPLQPFMIIREVTINEWLNELDPSVRNHPVNQSCTKNSFFYEISVD